MRFSDLHGRWWAELMAGTGGGYHLRLMGFSCTGQGGRDGVRVHDLLFAASGLQPTCSLPSDSSVRARVAQVLMDPAAA